MFDIKHFGDFQLTEAIRPLQSDMDPREGYRYDFNLHLQLGIIIAQVSAPKLFDVFWDLVRTLGDSLEVILELHSVVKPVQYFRRVGVEFETLSRDAREYADVFVDDGFTGLSVMSTNHPREVFLDDHKLLILVGSPQEIYERVLAKHGVPFRRNLKLISETEHVHRGWIPTANRFNEFRDRLACQPWTMPLPDAPF